MTTTAISRALRHSGWSTAAWVLLSVAPVVYGWAILAALAGVLPARAALAAIGVGPVLCAVLLVRLALVLPHGACRGAGMLALGSLAAGAALVVLAAVPHGWGARLLAIGFTISAALCLLGLLMLPGTAPNWRIRLRRLLDGFGIGISVFYAAWLLVIVPLEGDGLGPSGPRVLLAVLVWLVAAVSLACTVLISARAFRYRRAALACGAGVALVLLGQAVLVVLVLLRVPPAALFAAAAGTVAGPALIFLGASRSGTRTDTTGVTQPSSFAGMPLLSVPVALAVVATVYHLATVGTFGTYSAGVAVLVVLTVAGREAFAVFDVRCYAAELAEQEARFRSIVAGSDDVTMVLDESLIVRWQSPAAARRFGLSDAEVLGRPFSALFHPEDAPSLAEQLRELLVDPPDARVLVSGRLRDGFGTWRFTESSATDHRDEPAVAGVVVHLRDVSANRELTHQVSRLTYSDPLTGLPNRRALLRTLAELHDRPHPWRGCVLVLDLSGVQEVNETRGREVGDAVLVEVARRLRAALAPDHVLARLGGDEFAVLVGCAPATADGVAARLIGVLAEPYAVGGGRVLLGASAGVAEFVPTATPDELVAGADVAMRRAKTLGGNRSERYDESLEVQLMRRSMLTAELPGADRRGELDLLYQPIVAVGDRRPVAVEALLRWRHPQLGTVNPEEFVPIAEAAGLIDEIGGWVLHQACRRVATWRADDRPVQVAVNLSAVQLREPDFVAQVAAVLDAYEVPPEALIVEAGEADVVADVPAAVRTLGGLRELGVRVALDDFGTGHSALTYLRRLPVDILKADRALIAEPVSPGAPAAPLAEIVVRLGERLGMSVVAEGVETAEQVAALAAAGCGYAQGYLFGRPMPVEHVEAFFDLHSDGVPRVIGPSTVE
ncbi:GGDEF domain-containing protein [Actinocatenispora sera]|uniref:PAS domain S-box-containing protein/diguanylate cyclase (GGDEF)-like protein n=1 Tax=Actinocatenispora sera TaxID=390989 RepID=A0A810L7P7_9ACTN|nr:GGDEF domain-containing protein [Actinocatenispora sera]BCJ31189.1 hypothetical protein Asera_52970 [Actinocatenispora sera]